MQDASGQAIGFLLGSLSVSVALTSDACYKGLPKTPTGDVATFRGETNSGHVIALKCVIWYVHVDSVDIVELWLYVRWLVVVL